MFGYPDFDTANIAAESWFKDPDRGVARNAALNLRRLAPSPSPAREEPPRIRIEVSAATFRVEVAPSPTFRPKLVNLMAAAPAAKAQHA